MAENKKLYVVEQREENQNIPVLLAAPKQCRKPNEIPTNENLDFRTVSGSFLVEIGRV